MQTDFKKMTDASLHGPKRPQEGLLRLKGYFFVLFCVKTAPLWLCWWGTKTVPHSKKGTGYNIPRAPNYRQSNIAPRGTVLAPFFYFKHHHECVWWYLNLAIWNEVFRSNRKTVLFNGNGWANTSLIQSDPLTYQPSPSWDHPFSFSSLFIWNIVSETMENYTRSESLQWMASNNICWIPFRTHLCRLLFWLIWIAFSPSIC